jgi:DNA-binding NtrC family response regulator
MATSYVVAQEKFAYRSSAIVVSGSQPLALCKTLKSQQCLAEPARSGADALAQLETRRFDFALLDPKLPDLDAEEVRRMMKSQQPDLPVLFLDFTTGRLLAPEPVSGPVQEVLQVLQQAADAVSPTTVASPHAARRLEPAPQLELDLEPEPVVLRAPRVEPLPGMIGSSSVMAELYRMSRMVARRNATVLLEGASGTGKELVARAIHELSPRAKLPMITVNCAAIPEALLESELFGYVRGAFTGAMQSKLGRIHAAHGGTLFLDEVAELPLSMQAKLLRFLQEGEVQRLGSPDVFRVDVRVVAATNTQLLDRVKRAEFRQDLYYRLSVFPIQIPTLRDRGDDVIGLATHFLGDLCRHNKVPAKTLHASLRPILLGHSWPGNVRELQHAVERAFILSEDDLTLRPEHFLLQ